MQKVNESYQKFCFFNTEKSIDNFYIKDRECIQC